MWPTLQVMSACVRCEVGPPTWAVQVWAERVNEHGSWPGPEQK
jgi:hypothetical protein